MPIVRLFVILILGAMVVGCHRSPVDNQLEFVESIIEEHPDSALTILEAIDGSKLTGETQALHALLLSQAYDKNYIDLTDDSLITIATNYYLSSSDTHHKMLAYYYRAVINYCAGNYNSALFDALEAHELAKDMTNLARIESLIGRLYCRSKNYQESINWEQLSLLHNKMAGNIKWVPNNYINLGNNYVMMFQSEKALLYADSAQNILGKPDRDIDELRYYAYFFLDMNREADSLFKAMGEPEEFIRHQRIIHEEEENSEARLELSKELTREQNEFFYEVQTSSLHKTRNDYESSKRLLLQTKLRHERHIFIALIIIGVLVVGLLISLIGVIRLRTKTMILKSENDFALLAKEYESVKKQLQSHESIQRDFYNLKRDFSLSFLQKFSWIDQIGNLYADASLVSGKKDTSLYKKVDALIKEAKSNIFISNIEVAIKTTNPDFYDEIDKIGMSSSERMVFYYFLAGISPRVISLLTDKNLNSVYNIKSRVKKRLRLINTPTSLYLHDMI